MFFCTPSLNAQAGGVMAVSGKLISITDKEYAVETKSSIYYINRKAVPLEESKKITKTEVPVVLHVSFADINRIKKK